MATESALLSIYYDVGGVAPPAMLDDGVIYALGAEAPSDSVCAQLSDGTEKEVRFVELKGINISPVQMTLFHNGEDWRVYRLGTTPVWLDDKELETQNSKKLGADGVIKVPSATITLKQFGQGADSGAGEDPNLHWRTVQDDLNVEVLEEYRRIVGGGVDERLMSNEQIKNDARFIDILSRLAREFVEKMDGTGVNSAVSWSLRKFLVAKVAGAERNSALDDVPTQFVAQQLNLLGERIAGEIRLSLSPNQTDEDLERINQQLPQHLEKTVPAIPRGDRVEITKAFLCGNIWDFIFNFGPITDLMRLEVVSEVMVVAHDRIYLERSGSIEPYGYAFSSRRQLEVLVRRIANDAGREISESNAMVDFRLEDGSRVNVISTPLSLNGPCITIRKHRGGEAWSLNRLVGTGSLTQSMAWFLQACVLARKNIVISGGTGSGKTTLLNALSAFIPKNQRVVTIEDTAELVLENDHVVTLQSKPANAEGKNEIDIRKLVKNALRMRPDRIVVGECRGGEAVDMLQALNTGHAGSMTTGHANSAHDMLLRLEVMVLQGEPNLPVSAIRQQIKSAIDIILQINRTNGVRRVESINEVVGIDDDTGEVIVQPIFEFLHANDGSMTGRHFFTGTVPSFVESIHQHRPVVEQSDGVQQPIPLHEVFV